MSLPECPICHKPASLEGQQLYCVDCGWNRDPAMAAIRRSIKMIPVGIAVFAGFISFMIVGWHFRNPIQIAILGVGPALGILLSYVYSKRRLAKLAAIRASLAVPMAGSTSALRPGMAKSQPVAALKTDPQYETLLSRSRPRRIQMAKRGKINTLVGWAVTLSFGATFGTYVYGVWARMHSFATFGPKDWLMLGLTALIPLIPYGMWRSQARERDLLENGGIAMGRVTNQWLDEGNSLIQYEFKDFRGQSYRGSGYDHTKKLYKDMAVPVFYDMNNPKHRVAYCSALHEVVL